MLLVGSFGGKGIIEFFAIKVIGNGDCSINFFDGLNGLVRIRSLLVFLLIILTDLGILS